MDRNGDGPSAWRRAAEQVIADPDGDEIAVSQALWARAVREAFPEDGDVTCDGSAFGPILIRAGLVVHQPAVAVTAPDLAQAHTACWAAWRRFHLVDEDGYEHAEEGETEAPDPFGHPVERDDVVLVGFDVRADSEPYPYRAITHLRILAEELRRHGCTPASIASPAAAGTRAATQSRNGGEVAPAPAQRDHARISESRPEWLPAFRQEDRATRGLPTGPVPFVLTVRMRPYAWDPERGLLELPGFEEEVPGRVTIRADCLSADGRRLRYERGEGPTPDSPPPGLVEYELASGRKHLVTDSRELRTVAESEDRWPRLIRYAEPSGSGRLELLTSPDGPVRALPMSDMLFSDMTGPAAQFSPSGRRLLTSHVRTAGGGTYVALTDLGGEVRSFDDLVLCGSTVWSPDETRCLVAKSNGSGVLDLTTGGLTRLNLNRVPGRDHPRRG